MRSIFKNPRDFFAIFPTNLKIEGPTFPRSPPKNPRVLPIAFAGPPINGVFPAISKVVFNPPITLPGALEANPFTPFQALEINPFIPPGGFLSTSPASFAVIETYFPPIIVPFEESPLSRISLANFLLAASVALLIGTLGPPTLDPIPPRPVVTFGLPPGFPPGFAPPVLPLKKSLILLNANLNGAARIARVIAPIVPIIPSIPPFNNANIPPTVKRVFPTSAAIDSNLPILPSAFAFIASSP